MRFNNKEIINIHLDPIFEGRMSYMKLSNGGFTSKGYKERWFRLKYNLLFYFKINGHGRVDLTQPAGVIVLENSIVKLENKLPGTLFSFSLSFKDESYEKYIISSHSENHVHQWVRYIQCATYEYMRTQLLILQNRIIKLTGKDPLLTHPVEGKHLVRSIQLEDDDFNFCPSTETLLPPLPPPRHKQDNASKSSSSLNLIEL